jgi:hypothetical protein
MDWGACVISRKTIPVDVLFAIYCSAASENQFDNHEILAGVTTA